MANHEACELYIEQQIEEGLEDGKTPYTIGKELSTWIAKLFEVKIPSDTLKNRAARKKNKIDSNGSNKKNVTKTSGNEKLEKLEKNTHGGPRPGSGRKPKQIEPPPTWTCTECGQSWPIEVQECPCQSLFSPKPKRKRAPNMEYDFMPTEDYFTALSPLKDWLISKREIGWKGGERQFVKKSILGLTKLI